MTKASEADPTELADDSDEGTVELQLFPEHALALSQAEEDHAAANPVESTPGPPIPASTFAKQASQANGAARFGRWPMTLVVGVLAIAAVIAMWGTVRRAPDRYSSMPTETINVPVSTAPAATPPADSQSPPFRLRNPFDASEVFEFPPGTNQTEARQALAQLLLHRARERRTQAGRTKHKNGNRVAPAGPAKALAKPRTQYQLTERRPAA